MIPGLSIRVTSLLKRRSKNNSPSRPLAPIAFIILLLWSCNWMIVMRISDIGTSSTHYIQMGTQKNFSNEVNHDQYITENPEQKDSISDLLKQRSVNKTIILAAFNYGYRDMLSNLLCRFHQLNITNYVIPAFDMKAFNYCTIHNLPCFYAIDESGSGRESKESFDTDAEVQHFGSKGFERVTKQKPLQTLRALRLGYDVLWTDVDIFWKRDPRQDVVNQMGSDVDIGIQTDAVPSQNGNKNINSGFFYVRQSKVTISAFEEIVKDEESISSSDQVSFNNVLCASKIGTERCIWEKGPLKTLTLNRLRYPNGSMNESKAVSLTSSDEIVIVHFNYRKGRKAKEKSFKRAGMWLLQEPQGKCRV
jgi:hypothetical protein